MSPTKRYAWLGATALAAAMSIDGLPAAEAQWASAGAFSASPALAGEQDPPPGPPAAPQPPRPAQRPERPMPPEPPPPPRAGSNTNIRVEVTITDQSSGQAPVTKNVAMTVSDGHKGMIRSETQTHDPMLGGGVPLHVDAQPTAMDGKVRLRLGLSYVVGSGAGKAGEPAGTPFVRKNDIREELTVTLENGKPMVVSQSADPLSDRKVTVEVKATILK